MNAETAINKILASDASKALKILRLENLALRCFASSPNQKAALAACKVLKDDDYPDPADRWEGWPEPPMK